MHERGRKAHNLIGYDNCISLGWFCGTAEAMSHCGLRSHAGPFDWYFSDFKSVMEVMETDFSDFMKKENLLLESNNVFRDVKYGFRYLHDIVADFDKEYLAIYQKYMRRVERFQRDTHFPTCFIRAVKSEDEIEYIEKNKKYIDKIIKKNNYKNEIVFLLLNQMRDLSDDFIWFRLGIEKYVSEIYEMRVMFEYSLDFSTQCRTILSDKVMKKNIEFDRKNLDLDVKINCLMHRMSADKNKIADVFGEIYPDIACGMFLWGAGCFGEIMLHWFIRNGIKVNAVIDNSPEKIGDFFEEILVIPFSEVKQNSNIFIAIGNKKSTDEIKKQITDKELKVKVYSLLDLCLHSQIALSI